MSETGVMQPTSPPPATTVCSARACRATAAWALRWNNPRLHEPQRRKTWMACETHRAGLAEFLDRRGFLRETVPAQVVIDLEAAAARDRTRSGIAPPAGTVSQPR
jgi:hypothetical protein